MKRGSRKSLFFILFLVILQLGLMGYYEWTYFYSYVHSDISADLVMADHMANMGEWIFCSDWRFSSEIHFLHTQLIMVPLFHLFHSYRLVQLITCILALVMCGILSAVVTYELCSDWTLSLLSVLLLWAPLSEQYVLGFQALASSSYIFFTLLFWAMYLHWIKSQKKLWLIFIFLLSLLMGMCGIRFWVILFAPFILMFFGDFFRENLHKEKIEVNKKNLLEILGIAGSAALGLLIFKVGLEPKYGAGTAGSAVWVSGEETMENILYTPFALLECFGGFQMEGFSVLCIHGIIQIVFFAAAISFYFIWGYSYIKRSSIYDTETILGRKFLAYALVVNVCMIGFTNMGQAWGRKMEIHYLVLALVLFYPVVLALLKQCKMNKWFKGIAVFLACLYVVGSDGSLFADTQLKEKPVYATWLEEQGYSFGWSYDYWIGGPVTTAYTDANVEVCYIRTPEFSAKEVQLTKISNGDRMPEFITFPSDVDSETILMDCPLAYEEVYQDAEVIIYELGRK